MKKLLLQSFYQASFVSGFQEEMWATGCCAGYITFVSISDIW